MLSRALSICWMVLLVLGLSLVSNEAVSVNGNGYEFTIAISEDAMNITADDRLPFLESLKVSYSPYLLLDSAKFVKKNLLLLCLRKQKTITF